MFWPPPFRVVFRASIPGWRRASRRGVGPCSLRPARRGSRRVRSSRALPPARGRRRCRRAASARARARPTAGPRWPASRGLRPGWRSRAGRSRGSPEAAESTMTRSASSAIAANSGERGENAPGYQRKTGRSGIRSGPARLSRCARRGTFGVDRDLLGAHLRAAATPGVAEGREAHVHVRLAFGVGDEHHGPRRVTARQLRDGGRDLLVPIPRPSPRSG